MLHFPVNGNGQIWDGGGPFYWVSETTTIVRFLDFLTHSSQDGLGTNGGVTKPHPMMKYVDLTKTMSSLTNLIDTTGSRFRAHCLYATSCLNAISSFDLVLGCSRRQCACTMLLFDQSWPAGRQRYHCRRQWAFIFLLTVVFLTFPMRRSRKLP